MGFDAFEPFVGSSPSSGSNHVNPVPWIVPTLNHIHPHPIDSSPFQSMSVLFLSMPIRPMCRRFLWTSCWSVWRKNRKLNSRKKRAGTAKLSSWSLVGPSRGLNYHILFIFTLMSKLPCIQDWNCVGKWFYISLQNCLGPRSLEQRRSASAWVLATTGGKFIRYVHYVWYILYIYVHLVLALNIFHLSAYHIPYLPCRV